VIYRPVVDRFFTHIPLDPATAVLFAAVFITTALLTTRRATYGLVLLIVVQPFALYRDIFATTITLPKTVLLGVVVGLTAYAGITRRLREPTVRVILLALLAYLIAMAISFVHAMYPGATLREVLKVAEYAVLFAAAYLCYRLEQHDRIIVGAVAAVTIVVTLTALVEEVIGAPSGLCIGTSIIPRIAGVLEGPNQLAAYLEIAVATLGPWAMARRSTLLGAALGLAACTDVLTFSRASVAAMVIVVIAWIVYDRRSVRSALVPVVLGALAGLGIAGAWETYAHTSALARLSFSPSNCAGSVGSRPELYRAAFAMWLRHPLFGVGAGNFELELYQAGVLGVRTHANSWYLQSLAEGGLVLFVATLGLVTATLVSFGRHLRERSPWIVGAFVATLALALHQIVDYLIFYPKIAGPWLILLGIAAAALAANQRNEIPSH
jgi:O-antigen ligase